MPQQRPQPNELDRPLTRKLLLFQTSLTWIFLFFPAQCHPRNLETGALGLIGFCGGWKSVGFVMLTFLYGRYTAASPPRPVLDELSSDFDVKGTDRGPMAPLNDTEAESSVWDQWISRSFPAWLSKSSGLRRHLPRGRFQCTSHHYQEILETRGGRR